MAGRGWRGAGQDEVLLDLRAQLQSIARSPQLPPGWHLETATATAGGARFGGDLTVSVPDPQAGRLELVTVDVSGKGLGAGVRALLLTGAVSALMTVVAPTALMAALNRHILRQAWEDGFATAVHVGVDLHTGDFTLTDAGHPPVVQFRAATGSWDVLPQGGSLLGVLEDGAWPLVRGRLEPGDALIVYTDGMIERRGENLADGIDRLLGAAERVMVRGFLGGAEALIDKVASTGDDDRNVSLLWRDPWRPPPS